MSNENEIDLGVALLKARIAKIARTGQPTGISRRRKDSNHLGQQSCAVVYVLSLFRRRRPQWETPGPTTA